MSTPIKGPVKIEISGAQGSGKSQLAQIVRKAIESQGIEKGVTITERQIESGAMDSLWVSGQEGGMSQKLQILKAALLCLVIGFMGLQMIDRSKGAEGAERKPLHTVRQEFPIPEITPSDGAWVVGFCDMARLQNHGRAMQRGRSAERLGAFMVHYPDHREVHVDCKKLTLRIGTWSKSEGAQQ